MADFIETELGVKLIIDKDAAEAAVNEFKSEIKNLDKALESVGRHSGIEKFWNSQLSQIDAVKKSYKSFSQVMHQTDKESQEAASNFIKSFRSYEARGFDTSLLHNEFGKDEFNDVLGKAEKLQPVVALEYDTKGLTEMFTALDIANEAGINLTKTFESLNQMSESDKDTKISELVAELEEANTKAQEAERSLSHYQSLISSLKSELGDLKSGAAFQEMEDKAKTADRVIKGLQEDFAYFLKASGFSDRDAGLVLGEVDPDMMQDSMFHKYFNQIAEGSITAKEAMAQVRLEYQELFQGAETSGEGMFNAAQVEQFMAKLQSMYSMLEEVRSMIQGIQQDGVKMSGEAQVENAGTNIAAVGQKINEVVEQFSGSKENVAEFTNTVGDLIVKLAELGNVGADGLISINNIVRGLNTMNGMEIGKSSVNNLITLFDAMKQLPAGGSGFNISLDLSGLDGIKVSKTTADALVALINGITGTTGELPDLSKLNLSQLKDIDVDKLNGLKISKSVGDAFNILAQATNGLNISTLKELSEINFDKLNNLKFSKSTAQNLANLAEVSKMLEEVKGRLREVENAQKGLEGKKKDSTGRITDDKYSGVWKKAEESAIKDTYSYQLAKIKELDGAYKTLSSTMLAMQKEPNDPMLAQAFEDAKKRVQELEAEIAKFDNRFTGKEGTLTTALLGKDAINKYKNAQASANESKFKYLAQELQNQYRLSRSEDLGLGLNGDQIAQAKARIEELKIAIDQLKGDGTSEQLLSAFEGSTNIDAARVSVTNFSTSIAEAKQSCKDFGQLGTVVSNAFNLISGNAQVLFEDLSKGKVSFEDFQAGLEKLKSSKKFVEDALKIDGVNDLDKLLSSIGKDKVTKTYNAVSEQFTAIQRNLLEGMTNGTADEGFIKKIIADAQDLNQVIGEIKRSGGFTEVFKGDEIKFDKQYAEDFVAQAKNYKQIIGDVKQDTENNTLSFKVETNKGEIKNVTLSIKELGAGLRAVKEESKGIGTGFGGQIVQGMLNSLSQLSTRFLSTYKIVGIFTKGIREGMNTLKEYDSALTTISYTMNVSKEELNQMGQAAIDMAKDLSLSLKDAYDIYEIYANMNTSAEEIATTARPTAILSNLAGISASEAANDIQSVLNQFDMAADQAAHVIDVYDYVSSQISVDYGKGIKGIAESVSVVGNVAYQAGLSFEQLSAVIAHTMEQTRQEGSQIANSLKTIMTRLSKASTMSDEVDNETISKAANALHQIGVEVYTASGEYREFDTIMGELAERYDDLTDAQQANISFQLAA